MLKWTFSVLLEDRNERDGYFERKILVDCQELQ
jgi:hypothetical protein